MNGDIGSAADLRVGDVIRYNGSPYFNHSIIIINIKGNTVTYIDANSSGTGDGIVKRHEEDFSKIKEYLGTKLVDENGLSAYITRAEGNTVTSIDGDTEKPVITYLGQDIKTSTSNTMNVRAWATDNVGVTRVQMKIWRSGYGSNTGTTKEAKYNSTGKYWEVNFSESEIKQGNTGGVVCVEAWAYDKEGNKSDSAANYNFPFAGKTTGLKTFKARIVLKNNKNYCLGIAGKNNGDALQLKTKSTTDNTQIWQITESADGFYKIINVSANKSIDIQGGAGVDNNGAKMQLWSYVQNQTSHQFMLQKYNEGYRIVPTNTGNVRALDVKDGKIQNNQEIQLYTAETSNNNSQTWVFEEIAEAGVTATISDRTKQLNKAGEKKQLKINLSNGKTALATWSTTNSNIVSVDSDGTITAKSGGFAYVTGQSAYGTFKCWVYVAIPIKLSDGTLQFAGDINKENTFSGINVALILDIANRTSVTNDEKKIADLNGDGKVTKEDSDLMSDIFNTDCFSLYNATGIPLKKLSFSKTNIQINNGATQRLSIVKDPINATSENTIIWSSSNTNIVEVNSNGTITAKKLGTATITAKTADGSKTATCNVTVKQPSYILGDVNEDGKVNTLDAVKILQYVAKKTTLTDNQKLAANTNRDGKVNTLDAVKILQYVAKKITKF